MIEFLILLMVLVFSCVVLFVAFCVNSLFVWFGQWSKSYQKLGERYRGLVKVGNLFFPPSLTFRHGESNCALRNKRPKIGDAFTEFSVDGHDPKIRLLVSARGGGPSRWSNRGLEVVAVPMEFSSEFEVYGNKLVHSGKWSNSGVLRKLRQWDGAPVSARLERGMLRICHEGFIKEFDLLNRFVRFALELHHQMVVRPMEEIEFFEDGQVFNIEAVQCPVCSGLIQQVMVVCVRCKTPHCDDCWEYNGQCATFGCSETRFVRSSVNSVSAVPDL